MKLPTNWQLPETIQLRFGETSYGKQRAMAAEGHLLLILHKLPTWGQRERQAVLFWRNPEGAWHFSGRGGNGLAALRKHVEEFEDAETKLDSHYDAAKIAADYFAVLENLSPILHAAGNLHTALQAAREAVPADRDLIDLRDDAAEIQRNLDLLYTASKNALDFEIAKQAEEQARLAEDSVRIANRLNVIAAIFVPLTAISGIFGMNLAHGFDASKVWIFWVVLAVGVFIGLVLKGWVLKRPPEG